MRRRLVLAIAGVAALAVTLFAIPLALALQRSYRDQELLRLQRDAVAATRRIDIGRPGDPVELPAGAEPLAVYDRAGRRVAGAGPPGADGVVRAALASGRTVDATGDGRLRVAVPLVVGERIRGAVRLTRSDARVTSRAHRAWLALAGLGAAVVAVAGGAALVLGRRLTAPLDRLAATARRLGEGDFSARAPRSGVAELDAVAATLDATAARLDDLVSREREFSANASHQLRTPLASLRLELEAMQLRGDASEEVTAALAQVDRLQATVETLLAVARDAPGRDGRADLVAAAEALEVRWRGELAAASRPLRVRIDARPAVARASAAVVAEILDILLDNARVHGAGAVEVTVRGVDDALAVDVADAGPGLAGDPDAAFARRTESGHGIGLALARSLAHAEGGRLVVSRAAPRPVFTLLLAAA